MTKTFSKDTSGTELVTGILGTIDYGQILTKVVEITKEQENTQDILNQIKALVEAQDGGYTKIIKDLLQHDFEEILPKVLEYYRMHLRNIASFTRNQVMLSVLGYQGSAAMAGLYNKLYASFTGVSFLHDALYGSILEFLSDNAARYWRKTLAPNPPTTEEALRLLRHGKISLQEWVKLKREESGVTEDYAYKIFDTLYRIPDEYTLYKMYKRGIITFDQYINYMKCLGYKEDMIDYLYDSMAYVPSFYDLTRLADYVPLDTLYISEVLKKNGVPEADIPRLTTYLQRRPLREETRSVLGRLLFEYSMGRITKEYMLSQFDTLGILPAEKSLYEYWADLQYRDNLMDLQIDIIQEKVKKGYYTTQEDIKNDLVALGLVEEYANLLAEKWYWQYIAPGAGG